MTSPHLLFDAGAKSWKAGGIIFRRWNPRPARFFVRPALQSLEIPAESSKKLHGTPFAVQALRPKRLRRYKHVREQTRNPPVLRLPDLCHSLCSTWPVNGSQQNESVYGASVDAKQILNGTTAMNITVRSFMDVLDKVVPKKRLSQR